jgi:hypothetical protein
MRATMRSSTTRNRIFDFCVSVQRPGRFFGAVGLAKLAKKNHPLLPSGALDPGGIETISQW